MLGAVLAATIGVGALLAAPPALAARAPDGYLPPSVTVETPVTDDCAQRHQPPPAVDTSEDVPPGVAPPTPLPVPGDPVGGGPDSASAA